MSSLADLDRVIEAINALRTMRETKEPRKLDDALTWRANDELAERMADEALTLLRTMREGAVEGYVDASQLEPEPWVYVYFEQGIQRGDPCVPALLLLTPEDDG